MIPTSFVLFVAQEHCPSIGARKNDIILELPSGHACVFHPADMKQLTEEDRAKLTPYPKSA
jgi:hypothetical protein